MDQVETDAATRAEVEHFLQDVLKRVTAAESLLLQGDDLAAMRSLLKARRLSGQATATLIANCLRRAFANVDSADRYTREQCLDEFIRLIDFAETTLCPTCRRRVAAKLKGR